jgi:hypothetical protein
MMTVAIAKGDAAYAREAYYQMSEVGKASVMTRYLMFKIALQEGDAQLGMSCGFSCKARCMLINYSRRVARRSSQSLIERNREVSFCLRT